MVWIVISFVIQSNEILWRNARLLSLTTQIRRSISGTCLFALVRVTLGPAGIFWIRSLSAPNSPSACTVWMRKPRYRYNLKIALKALNIIAAVRPCRWLTPVKSIFLLRGIKNGIPLTKKLSAVKNIFFLRLAISLRIFIQSEATTVGLLLTVLSFRALMYFPHISWAVSIFRTDTSQLLICLFFNHQLKSVFGGYNSLAYSFLAAFAPSMSHLVKAFMSSSTVFISTIFFMSSG